MQKKPNPAVSAALATAAIVGDVSLPGGKTEQPEPEHKCECGAAMVEPQKPDKKVLAYCLKCGRLKRREATEIE